MKTKTMYEIIPLEGKRRSDRNLYSGLEEAENATNMCPVLFQKVEILKIEK